MSDRKITDVANAIDALSPKDLDEASVDALLQLQFVMLRRIASIQVKTIGRMHAQLLERGLLPMHVTFKEAGDT